MRFGEQLSDSRAIDPTASDEDLATAVDFGNYIGQQAVVGEFATIILHNNMHSWPVTDLDITIEIDGGDLPDFVFSEPGPFTTGQEISDAIQAAIVAASRDGEIMAREMWSDYPGGIQSSDTQIQRLVSGPDRSLGLTVYAATANLPPSTPAINVPVVGGRTKTENRRWFWGQNLVPGVSEEWTIGARTSAGTKAAIAITITNFGSWFDHFRIEVLVNNATRFAVTTTGGTHTAQAASVQAAIVSAGLDTLIEAVGLFDVNIGTWVEIRSLSVGGDTILTLLRFVPEVDIGDPLHRAYFGTPSVTAGFAPVAEQGESHQGTDATPDRFWSNIFARNMSGVENATFYGRSPTGAPYTEDATIDDEFAYGGIAGVSAEIAPGGVGTFIRWNVCPLAGGHLYAEPSTVGPATANISFNYSLGGMVQAAAYGDNSTAGASATGPGHVWGTAAAWSDNATSFLAANGVGAWCQGYARADDGTAEIQAYQYYSSVNGAFALALNGGNAQIRSGDAFAGTQEAPMASGRAVADGASAFAFIQAYETAAFARGNAYAETARTALLKSSGLASVVFANVEAIATNATAQATGKGACVFGSVTDDIMEATAENAVQFGPGSNAVPDSVQVGTGWSARRDGRTGSKKAPLTLGVADTTFEAASSFMVITGDAGANTIATITGGFDGMRLVLLFVDALVTITDDSAHGADSVDLSAAFTSADDAILELIHDGTSWYEISRSVN